MNRCASASSAGSPTGEFVTKRLHCGPSLPGYIVL